MLRKFIIGLGTGRCGTNSLADLLNMQPGINISHEYLFPLPWNFSLEVIQRRIYDLRKKNGDVAFYYLNYVEHINSVYPSSKFVCLKRDKAGTIMSYMKKSENRNNWIEHNGNKWSKSKFFYNSYPKFDVELKEEALDKYYELYYSKARKLEETMPNFKIFDLNDLNTQSGVLKILDFCGFEKDEMNIIIQIKVNQSKIL